MRIIIDTNVFVSGIFWSGPSYTILKKWQENNIKLVLSPDILDEYIRVSNVLSEKYHVENLSKIINLVIKHSEICKPKNYRKKITRDADDDKFIYCALYAKVKMIVSGDNDLLDVDGYNDINILTPKTFVNKHINH